MTVFPLICVGFLVGCLVGLTSMGGAALMTPFLILVLGVRPVLAVGTDLAYGAVTKVFGAAVHWRQRTVDFAIVRRLAMGSVPGGVAGVLAVEYLRKAGYNPDLLVRRSLGVALVIVAILLLGRTLLRESDKLQVPEWLRAAVPLWGAVVGFAVGFTSVGSGSLIAPMLMVLYPMPAARVVGTDLFHAAILVVCTSALYAQAGQVDWVLASTLLIGSIPGVFVGSMLAPHLPQKGMRIGLCALLLATGIKLV